jgi:hypothetical protein
MSNDQPRASSETGSQVRAGEAADQLGRLEMLRIAMRQSFETLSDLSRVGPTMNVT